MNSFLVNHFLENSAARLPDKTALVCGEQRLTYQQLNDSANRLGAALVDMGIGRQDRVIIFLDNSAECVISLFGVLKAGAIFVILNPTMKSKKLNYILRDSGARAIITQGNKFQIINEALNKTPDLRHIIWIEKPTSSFTIDASGIVQNVWGDLFSRVEDSPLTRSTVGIDVDLATIIYTSGSTGEPKGVMSAHYNMVAAARSITQYLENVEDDIILNALPLSFDYGLYQVVMAFMFGGTVVMEKSFLYPVTILKTIEREKVTGFPIVPTIAAMLLKMKNLSEFELSSLRYVTNTASALPVEYIRKLRALLPGVRIYSMYGLTECKRVAYMPPEELDRRPASVGRAMPNCEVFILDEEGREVAPGQTGELVIRGANVMQGYWNDPETTLKTFRPRRYPGERLLFSGDLFRKDEEGFLFFIGRKGDMIKTKGERVSPREIENALCETAGVAEAAVIGVPDEILGEAIEAYVVLSPGIQITEKKLLKYCAEHLEPFMVPRRVKILPELPKSPNGKVDKKALMSTAKD